MSGCPEFPQKRHVRKIDEKLSVVYSQVWILLIPYDNLAVTDNNQLIFLKIPTFPKFQLFLSFCFLRQNLAFSALLVFYVTRHLPQFLGVYLVAFLFPIFDYLRFTEL